MPVVYQGKELTFFKPKTGGKNQSPVDGFYENSNGERYFIKKPDNKVELFAELFAGLILKEFMKRKLIDTVYFPSLIVADDVVRFEDGTYGLIQPMVSFTQLHELIGTSFSDGKDRNSIKEALYGPQYYSALIQQQKYFGLSTALMFSLLLGAHSVHSGNVIALHNDKLLSRQYGRLDWGDAFRYFAHPENNNNLLFAYENRGWFNYKKLTKDYFLNYKLIPGLFPVMAEKGTSLVQQLQTNTLQDIVISALRNVPSDLIGHEIKNEFAHYTFMDSFKDVAFGPDSDGGQFAIDMANILKGRLEKITQLQDIISQTEAQTMYKSTISVPDPVLSVPQGTIFSDLLDKWNTLLLENKGAASIDTQQVNLSQLAIDFNKYLKMLAEQADQANLWKHASEDASNLFVPFNQKKADSAQHGHAFVAQYKESTIFRRLFSLEPNTMGTLRFAVYEQPTQEYAKMFPDSPWSKMQRLATAGHDVIQTLRLIQNARNYGLEGVTEESVPILRQSLQSFMGLKGEVDDLLGQRSEFSEALPSSFFYPIDDLALNMMSGDQLATLCLEELNNPQPSLLVARVIKNNDLWQKLNESLNSGVFNGRVDGVGEKIVKLQECHQLLQVAVLAEGEKKSTEEERRLQQIEEEQTQNKAQVVQLESELAQLRKENFSNTEELQKKNTVLEKQLQERKKELDSAKKIINESIEAQNRHEQALKEKKDIQFARTLKIAPVLNQLEYVEKKALDLKAREEQKAFNAANELVSQMREAVQKYIDSDESEEVALAAFKDHSQKLIQQAEEPLSEHRQQWKYILANLSLAVLSVGVGYLIAMLINKGVNDRYTFFSVTKSKEQLDELKTSAMILSY